MCEQQPEIQVGQTWRRMSDGREVQVENVRDNFVEISWRGQYFYPWTKAFLKKYKLVEDATDG